MKKGKEYKYKYILIALVDISAFFFHLNVQAQKDSSFLQKKIDTVGKKETVDYKNQMDIIDIVYRIFNKNPETRIDSTGTKTIRLYISAAPIVEYTIATGFSPGIAGNVVFKTSVKKHSKTSSLLGAVKYTQKKQFLVPIQSSFWAPGNKYDLIGDWRYLNYPQDTYGLGGHTTLSDKYIVNYKYIRLYEFVLRNIGKDLYGGLGYQLDYHWGINEMDVEAGRVTDFQKYGFSKTSVSSGIAFNFLYDTRENAVNPEGGSFYANVRFLQNSTLMGAGSNWNSVTIDIRKYIKMPFKTILALWYYSVFTLSGNPPYLDLPSTGSDMYNNTGRGYEQGRFIGKKMIDMESELRFNISKNGLLGGVVFVNAESLSELENNKFEVISPAVGIGLRIKFNKFSKTNVCVDYGFGTNGSKGFAGNLGEVF